MNVIFPKKVPTLSTDSIVLKQITPDYLDSYAKLCMDAEVMHAYGSIPHKTKEETQNLIKFLQNELDQKRMIRWGIFEIDSPNTLIGDVGFWRFIDVRMRAEVGAKLNKGFWRKGTTSAALKLIIDYGFEHMNLHSVEGNADPNNYRSCGMVEKIGFVKEGYIKENSYNSVTGEFLDTVLYSMRREM